MKCGERTKHGGRCRNVVARKGGCHVHRPRVATSRNHRARAGVVSAGDKRKLKQYIASEKRDNAIEDYAVSITERLKDKVDRKERDLISIFRGAEHEEIAPHLASLGKINDKIEDARKVLDVNNGRDARQLEQIYRLKARGSHLSEIKPQRMPEV
eukprot:jgi/Mesvir1/19843/Mv13133-RA.1